jgi:hypothetical protein
MARKRSLGKPAVGSPASTRPIQHATLNATAPESFVGIVIPTSVASSSSAVPSPALSTNGGTSTNSPATSAAPSAAGSKRKRLSASASKRNALSSNETANDEEVARQLQADEYDGPPASKKLNVSQSPFEEFLLNSPSLVRAMRMVPNCPTFLVMPSRSSSRPQKDYRLLTQPPYPPYSVVSIFKLCLARTKLASLQTPHLGDSHWRTGWKAVPVYASVVNYICHHHHASSTHRPCS